MMQLYASARGPHIEPFYPADESRNPASAYALQERLRKAYQEVLLNWWDIDALILACFGERHGKRRFAAEERLQYEVPELLERMSAKELALAAQIFRTSTLVGFVWHVLGQERSVQHRLEEPCDQRLCDDKHARAASLGQGQWKRGQRHAPPVPCSCHLPSPAPRERNTPSGPVGSHTAVPVPAAPVAAAQPLPASMSAAQNHRYRVKQAQERKRLKRKRR
ncbi:hypothetical protein [Hymenobacter sp. YC55]|uniref:hypothetical protein n=1 Tax=Hymenobacter sp. YC55 TaxID=3034019 RepID=UPI0023F906D0|nr:hypothetical protein [Hymenobacter sp. YC55]MDF7810934.1 hypothetical protein [Hymenobacter sp. YC55]